MGDGGMEAADALESPAVKSQHVCKTGWWKGKPAYLVRSKPPSSSGSAELGLVGPWTGDLLRDVHGGLLLWGGRAASILEGLRSSWAAGCSGVLP